MSSKFFPVWLLVKRELRDQFRDWRILLPLTILSFIFPFLMNEVAHQVVAFIKRYGANIIADRLVPFSILIIGFFPVTVSLVVALESFVGEKERGTIEPLLSAPLENWQLYMGKLAAGILTPLVSSYFSIGLYLYMVSYQDLNMPEPRIIAQLFALTAAHAFLMTSGAIVISVQSTSVKAANLLASFIVVPVAILVQGEASMLFWGTGTVLWYAVAAVMLLSALLIRVGIAHFQREYLLGREIDDINMRRTLSDFWNSFRGGAASIPEWYSKVVFQTVRKLKAPLISMVLIALVGSALGYYWVSTSLPVYLDKAPKEDAAKLLERIQNSPSVASLRENVSMSYLLGHNLRAVAAILLFGLLSFGVLGVLAYVINVAVIGGALGMFSVVGYSPGVLLLAGIMPHGIFEIPALVLGSAAVLRIGAALVTPQLGKSMGEVIVDLLADWAKVFVGLILPLLTVAAFIEANVTPMILAYYIK